MLDNSRLQEIFSKFKDEQYGTRDRDNKVLIVDGLNLFIRAFTATPTMNMRGEHVGGLTGFIKSLFSIIRQFRPTRCVLVFDGYDGSRARREKFSEYKSGRKNKDKFNRFVDLDGMLNEPASMQDQFMRLADYLAVLPISTVLVDYVEADDAIAHIVTKYYKDMDRSDMIIVSSDKDFLQLVTDRVKVYSPTKRKLYDRSKVVAEFGISPKNYLTFRALTGDASDNIPGIRGIGLKTMLKCFPEILDRDIEVEDIVSLSEQKIDDGSKLKAYRTVLDSTEQLSLNWELMQLQDVDIPSSKKLIIESMMDAQITQLDKLKFKQLIYRDGLDDHINHLDSWIYSTLTQLDIYAQQKAQ